MAAEWNAVRTAEYLNAEMPSGISKDTVFSGVSSDSRRIDSGTLFLPLCGERFNGCDFIEQAFAQGAAAAVWPLEDAGSRTLPQKFADRIFVVQSSLDASLALSRAHLDFCGVKVVGITGSVGKTTVKDLCRGIFSSKFNVRATIANHNSESGLAEMLMGLTPEHDIAVAEMGMRGFGQIKKLAETAAPNISIVTVIGESHLECLGTRENIAAAKSEIMDYAADGAVSVLPFDSDFFDLLSKHAKGKIVSFSLCSPQADWHLISSEDSFVYEDCGREGVRRIVTGQNVVFEGPAGKDSVFLPLPGKHNCANLLAVMAAAYELGICAEDVRRGLKNCEFTGKRLQSEIFADGTVLIDDSYNAAPASMKAALDVFRQISKVCCRKIAVLGDMKELGADEAAMHQAIGIKCAEVKTDILIGVGELSSYMTAEAGKHGVEVLLCSCWQEALEKLKEIMKSGDCILVKASHSVMLDKLAEGVRSSLA